MLINKQTLTSDGFEGFVPFEEIDIDMVPSGPGIYVVLKPVGFEPVFLEKSAGGHFKKQDPTITKDELIREWIKDADVLYIGKAGSGKTGNRGLRKRIKELTDFGRGKPVGHWGGRILWQLEASNSLNVGWKELPADQVNSVEASYHAEFVAQYGRLPFANLVQSRVV